MEWYLQELKFAKHFRDAEMPSDVLEHILSFVDGPMRRGEAEEHRQELMKERKFFVNQKTTELFERPFSLCEH
jgi:hypothetical protein